QGDDLRPVQLEQGPEQRRPPRPQPNHPEADRHVGHRPLDPPLRERPAGGGRGTQEPPAIQVDRGHGRGSRGMRWVDRAITVSYTIDDRPGNRSPIPPGDPRKSSKWLRSVPVPFLENGFVPSQPRSALAISS